MNAWEVRDLHKSYSAGWFGGRSSSALAGVSLTVRPGERVALIGESGSGKTTLTRVGLGLIPADKGTAKVLGRDVFTGSRADRLALRKDAQLLFQDPRAMLHPVMPIADLLAESIRLHRPEEKEVAIEVERMLDAVGLGGRGQAVLRELSGGEQRRAGLARVLTARPKLLVADEPTAGLDAALKASLVELVVERVGRECAVVLVSHDLPVVAWACDRIVVMHQGRIIDDRPVADLRGASDPIVRRLLASGGLA